jgi:hypothetical protein
LKLIGAPATELQKGFALVLSKPTKKTVDLQKTEIKHTKLSSIWKKRLVVGRLDDTALGGLILQYFGQLNDIHALPISSLEALPYKRPKGASCGPAYTEHWLPRLRPYQGFLTD